MTIIIDLRDASEREREIYGITHRSAHVYEMTGAGLHNRSHPHRVTVWNNTRRPNTRPDEWNEHSGKPGPGAYLDPRGKGTDEAVTVTTKAESIAITANGTNTGTVASGQVYAPEKLAIGAFALLRYPDGSLSDPFRVTARPLADPVLIPVS